MEGLFLQMFVFIIVANFSQQYDVRLDDLYLNNPYILCALACPMKATRTADKEYIHMEFVYISKLRTTWLAFFTN
jgi:hypothetical protein